MIFGTHNSCTNEIESSCCVYLWCQTQSSSLIEQFQMGIRLFDLRYKMIGNQYYISHTYPTNYKVKDAFIELITCSQQANETVYIRLKRDSSSVPLPDFGTMFQTIHVENKRIEKYIIRQPLEYIEPGQLTVPTIILFCDNDTLRDDHMPVNWYGPMLFDAIETWNCQSIMEASDLIHARSFQYNGLPKAIFLDYSSYYPPYYTTPLLWNEVKKEIQTMIIKKEIQCVMLNFVTPEIIQELQHSIIE